MFLGLTAVFLIAPVRTVAEAVAAETPDDAVDAVGAGEERRGTLGLELSWGRDGELGEYTTTRKALGEATPPPLAGSHTSLHNIAGCFAIKAP